MANDTHIVRHDEPAMSYGGFTREQHEAIAWKRVYHPIFDPEPKPKSWFRAMLAWALAALYTAP
jgi:hypothetical protein